MDVLFKSIDVRDLLSTTDVDESSPLTSPDLRLLIHRLDAHSHQIKSRVHDYLLSHSSHFSHLLSLSSDSLSQSLAISSQIESILSILTEKDSIDVEIRDTVSEIRVSERELERRSAELGIVKIIVELSEKLGNVRELIRVGRLVEAAEGVRVLKVALRVGEDEEKERESGVIVYELLRREWVDCFEKIQEFLVKFMNNAVRFEPESGRIRVMHHLNVGELDRIELHTVLKAMEVLGILNYGLARTADLFIKHTVSPALNLGTYVSFVEESSTKVGDDTEAILKIVPFSNSKTEDVEGKSLFPRMMEVVKFIYKYICLQNGLWMRHFGKLTWPRMSELIISKFLSKVVPDDASNLADFQRVVSISSEFETSLKEIMFISSEKSDERLSNFADNVEVHFAVRKKSEILAKARQLMLQCDFTLPQEFSRKCNVQNDKNGNHVVDLLFTSERCIVSETASQLMKMVHRTLQDVCLSSLRVALEFYHAARDALLLYEAIVPVKLERQLESINQVAVLMHNDCLYLSQEILGLAFEYRPDFPGSIKEHAVFVDMAPRFQLLAEDVLQKHIQIVILNLREAIDGADGFQNTHQIQQYESAKFSMDQIVFILEKIRLIWEPVLLPSTYKISMCMVLESVFSRITRDILVLDDIAAEETLQLQRLIHMLLENLSSLLESLTAINMNKTSDAYCTRPLEVDIPSLGKIRKLADLLDMSLKSITEAWESGDLFGCGYILTEVVDFIKAIFTDSPLRKDCLWRIQSIDF